MLTSPPNSSHSVRHRWRRRRRRWVPFAAIVTIRQHSRQRQWHLLARPSNAGTTLLFQPTPLSLRGFLRALLGLALLLLPSLPHLRSGFKQVGGRSTPFQDKPSIQLGFHLGIIGVGARFVGSQPSPHVVPIRRRTRRLAGVNRLIRRARLTKRGAHAHRYVLPPLTGQDGPRLARRALGHAAGKLLRRR